MRELGARRSEVGQADPAVAVLTEVDDVAVGAPSSRDRDRPELFDPPHGWRDAARTARRSRDPRRATRGPTPSGRCRARPTDRRGGGGRAPRRRSRSAREDVARGRAPRGVGPTRSSSPEREREVSSARTARRGAVAVDPPSEAVSVPATSRRSGARRARSRPASTRSVTSNVCTWSRLPVRREARRELVVADPGAVEERLVDAVRGDPQLGGGNLAGDVEVTGKEVCGPLARRRVRSLLRLDPRCAPADRHARHGPSLARALGCGSPERGDA